MTGVQTCALPIYLLNTDLALLDKWEYEIYGSNSDFYSININPTGNLFAIINYGNTGYEEDITYCWIFQVDQQRKLQLLFKSEKVGASKYRYTYKPIITWKPDDKFVVKMVKNFKEGLKMRANR